MTNKSYDFKDLNLNTYTKNKKFKPQTLLKRNAFNQRNIKQHPIYKKNIKEIKKKIKINKTINFAIYTLITLLSVNLIKASPIIIHHNNKNLDTILTLWNYEIQEISLEKNRLQIHSIIGSKEKINVINALKKIKRTKIKVSSFKRNNRSNLTKLECQI